MVNVTNTHVGMHRQQAGARNGVAGCNRDWPSRTVNTLLSLSRNKQSLLLEYAHIPLTQYVQSAHSSWGLQEHKLPPENVALK
jgi:hypothetical protein